MFERKNLNSLEAAIISPNSMEYLVVEEGEGNERDEAGDQKTAVVDVVPDLIVTNHIYQHILHLMYCG